MSSAIYRASGDHRARVLYLGLTPRRYEYGEASNNGRISKQGNRHTRKHLYEAANTLLTCNLRFSTLRAWGMKLAKVAGFKKARVAVARKLAVILPFQPADRTIMPRDQTPNSHGT